MQIVNGYVCQNCSDVDKAKKNVDPAPPQQARATDDTAKSKETVAPEAVTFGGTLSKTPDSRRDEDPGARERPAGPRVDVSA